MCDVEAWLELADIYLERLIYPKALYCYEEALIINPKNFYFFVKIAEVFKYNIYIYIIDNI